jgi:hypothetical protein
MTQNPETLRELTVAEVDEVAGAFLSFFSPQTNAAANVAFIPQVNAALVNLGGQINAALVGQGIGQLNI